MAQPTKSAEEILAQLDKFITGYAHMIVLMDRNIEARIVPLDEPTITTASTLVSFRNLICDDPRGLLSFIEQAKAEQGRVIRD